MNDLILFASGTLDSTTVMILSIAISCGLLAGFCYVALRLRGKLLKTMGEAVDAVLDKFILSRDTGVTAETVGGGVGNITSSTSDQAVSTAGGMARSAIRARQCARRPPAVQRYCTHSPRRPRPPAEKTSPRRSLPVGPGRCLLPVPRR